jgi:hypothetical protein
MDEAALFVSGLLFGFFATALCGTWELRKLKDKIIQLEADLKEARKNDYRDPKTGKFKKAPK